MLIPRALFLSDEIPPIKRYLSSVYASLTHNDRGGEEREDDEENSPRKQPSVCVLEIWEFQAVEMNETLRYQ